jgi:hypothetical protein
MPSWNAVHNKNHLLRAAMKHLAGDAQISFEGALEALGFFELHGIQAEETAILKRNTVWPRQDFVVASLSPESIQSLIKALGGTIPRSVLHIQVPKNGKLEFGAYDNFDPQTLFLGEAFSDELLNDLIAQGILEH